MSGLYGLVGGRLGHSYSKILHESLWAERYELMELDRPGVDEMLRRRSFAGINVTIPYKRTAFDACDKLDDGARATGCVNTVLNRGGKLFGYNTDLEGLAGMARRAGIELGGKKVVILGTGGTSLTALETAKRAGAGEIIRISRAGEDNYGNIGRHSDADVLINTTPVGMFPDCGAAPVSLDLFSHLAGVLDVVYNPLRTLLVLDALERRIPCCAGLYMLVRQAVASARLFAGTDFSEADTLSLLSLVRHMKQNVVLIGMPGSGKTTVGHELARLMDRELIDTDSLVESEAGMSIPEIFAAEGEAGFRARERRAVAAASLLQGVIIATGGGAVLDAANSAALRRSGRVYFLRRPLDRLARDGRPLSDSYAALCEMYEKRLPLYTKAADAEIENASEASDAAGAIMEDFQ